MLPLYNLKLCLTGQLEVFKSIIRDLHHPTLPNLFFLLTSLFMSPSPVPADLCFGKFMMLNSAYLLDMEENKDCAF